MIDKEATKEAFGYYPSELKPQSHKPILATCDDCGKVRETSKHSYRDLCWLCSQKGENNPNWKQKVECTCLRCGKKFKVCPSYTKNDKGKYCSRKCQSKARQNRIICTCQWCKKVFVVCSGQTKIGKGKFCSCRCAAKGRICNPKTRMTVPEKAFEAICVKNDLPFKFVGDGTLWLGNANPDFVHNTKKIVVEVFGDYWHSPLLRPALRDNETVEGRTEQLKKEGYKSIFIWESDLKREDAESFVLHLMKKEKII